MSFAWAFLLTGIFYLILEIIFKNWLWLAMGLSSILCGLLVNSPLLANVPRREGFVIICFAFGTAVLYATFIWLGQKFTYIKSDHVAE